MGNFVVPIYLPIIFNVIHMLGFSQNMIGFRFYYVLIHDSSIIREIYTKLLFCLDFKYLGLGEKQAIQLFQK